MAINTVTYNIILQAKLIRPVDVLYTVLLKMLPTKLTYHILQKKKILTYHIYVFRQVNI